jgi:hypothetical protein
VSWDDRSREAWRKFYQEREAQEASAPPPPPPWPPPARTDVVAEGPRGLAGLTDGTVAMRVEIAELKTQVNNLRSLALELGAARDTHRQRIDELEKAHRVQATKLGNLERQIGDRPSYFWDDATVWGVLHNVADKPYEGD